MSSSQNSPIKPILRGYIHQESFFFALGACTLLVLKSSDAKTFIASLVYSLGLLILLAVSAIYHRPNWQPFARSIMKRLDHSAIFLLIAGTFTPICMLALPEASGVPLLIGAWSVATVGILQSIFWVRAPKWFSALFYVGAGWMAAPYMNQLKNTLGLLNLWLIILGGVAYTVGAIIYALKKPQLRPHFFGYHELFHLLTVVGATLHFAVVYQLIH